MRIKFFVLSLLIIFLSCSDKDTQSKSLFDFIPSDANLVIKIDNLSAFRSSLETNDFLIDLKRISCIDSALTKIHFIDYITSQSNSALILSKNSNEPLFITDYHPHLFELDSVESTSITTQVVNGLSISQHIAKSTSFSSAKLGDKILVTSSSASLVKIIENSKNNTPPVGLKRLFEISGSKMASFYINLKEANSLFSCFLNKTGLEKINRFSEWISLDFSVDKTKVGFNGISMANDSIQNFTNLFANTKPDESTTLSMAPNDIHTVTSYSFGNYQVFSENQRLFLGDSSRRKPLFESVNELGAITKNGKRTIFLHTDGAEDIADFLKKNMLSSFDFQGNEIMRIQDTEFLNENLKPLLYDFKCNFATIISNSFVFAERSQELENIIRSNNDGSTFNKTNVYQSVKNSLIEESNLLFISSSNHIKKFPSQSFATSFKKELSKTFKSNYTIAAQVSADKSFYHTNITIQKIENKKSNGNLNPLFEVPLDTVHFNAPQFVTNHINGKKEIIIQDLKNTLYLISSSGKILWKKPLNSMIQGEIKQVDIFKNGRLQFAFTTNDQFMVLDRNGNEVRQFTKTYEGGNLNALAVFDYDSKKEYRFVVTQGDNVYMYNNKAEIVTGFKYTKAEGKIIKAPQHIRIGKKDFLLFQLENGSLKILNRVGTVRVPVHEKISFSKNRIYLNNNKFTLTDNEGTLYQINENGKTTKTNLNMSQDHGMFATGKTLVLMNDNILTIKAKQVELELGVYTSPKIFYINNKIYVSVTDLQHQKVYLFDSQAKPISGFPVFGNSIIDLGDIDKDKKLEVVVQGKKNSIITYKLN